MGDTVRIKDGKVYAISKGTLWEDPIEWENWYPLHIASHLVEDGAHCHYAGNGCYSVETVHHFDRQRYVRLSDGGDTKPSFHYEREVPKPKRVRSDLRWRNGHWEKYSKVKGWILA